METYSTQQSGKMLENLRKAIEQLQADDYVPYAIITSPTMYKWIEINCKKMEEYINIPKVCNAVHFMYGLKVKKDDELFYGGIIVDYKDYIRWENKKLARQEKKLYEETSKYFEKNKQ